MSEAVPTTVQPVTELLEKVRAYNPKLNEQLVIRAYEYGKQAHVGQFRRSGEPYFNHPVEVAKLLTEIHIDETSIVTALLHDTIEDTRVSFEDVAKEFGLEIAELVEGVTKLTNIQIGDSQSKEAENLRKLLLAMSKDVRVLLVKLADRLHNMRTIKSMPIEKQQKKAQETMDIFAPLAGRLGMQYLRDELEEAAFKVLNPKARASVLRKFVTLRGEETNLLKDIQDRIQSILDQAGISSKTMGREKSPYSVWRKLESKNIEFEHLTDIYGFRILTNEVEDCYRALGVVHTHFKVVPGRFKDYISQPKSNGYRSIHTSVSGFGGKRIEIQIRTRKMHIVAESGVAAHWSYKDGERVDNPYVVDPSGWLKQLNDGILSHDDDEFLENFRLEMYSDQVFVFSPKGAVVKLPKGATVLDFAYTIHTDLGNHAIGAIVNGRKRSLTSVLRNGQTVQIIRANESKPNPQWIDYVKTGRARSSIKRAFRTEKRKHDISLGRSIVDVALSLINKKITDKAVELAAKELNFASVDALLEAVGKAEISGKHVVAAIYPELANFSESDLDPVAIPPMIGQNPAFASRPCPSCIPIPGDRIVGLAKKGEGIEYHVIDCSELANAANDLTWVDLKWPTEREGAVYPSKIQVTMANDSGVLGRVCTIIGENHANIEQVEFAEKRPDVFNVIFELSVRDAEHVYHILKALSVDIAVTSAVRFRSDGSV